MPRQWPVSKYVSARPHHATEADAKASLWKLKLTHYRPFVSFDEAMESVGELEASNLKVDPVVLPELVGDPEDE